MAQYTDDYPNKKTQAQLDALTKAKITDFKVGFKWDSAEDIGEVQSGSPTANPPTDTYAPGFILRQHVVTETNINNDLFEFQNAVAGSNAYVSTASSTTTAPATTTA